MNFSRKIRKHKDLLHEENLEDLEVLPEEQELSALVPWNLWRTRLDVLSYFNPFSMMDFYFVRHSTGPSYTYLIFSSMAIILYSALVIYRFLSDRATEETTFQSEKNLSFFRGFTSFPLPQETGFAIYNGTSLVTSALFSYSLCSQSKVGAGEWRAPFDANAQGVVCSSFDLAASPCSDFSSHQCLPTESSARLLVSHPLPGSMPSSENWYYGIVRATLPNTLLGNATSLSGFTLSVTGFTSNAEVESTRIIEDEWFRQTLNISIPLQKSVTKAATFNYEAVKVQDLARYVITTSQVEITRYLDHTVTSRVASSNVVFESLFVLAPRTRVVYRTQITFVDILNNICSLMLVLHAMGWLFRLYNKWHFLNFGAFESAELPEYYVDCLLDPSVPTGTPGLVEMHDLRKNDGFFQKTSEIKSLYKDIRTVRTVLDHTIKPNSSMEIEEDDDA